MNKRLFLSFASLMVATIALLGGFFAVKTIFSSSFSISFDINKAIERESIIPVAIIGSGPAGLSAAIYSARAGVPTFVLEGNKPGGLLTETSDVENYPGYNSILGPDLIKETRMQAERVGAQFITDAVARVDFSQWPFVLHTEDGKVLHALTVIIATGATPRKLQVPGEEAYWGSGVTSCAVCDAPFFKDEEVVVVGGGDSAVEEAIQLSSYAREITVLVRKDHMRAVATMQNRLKGYSNIAVQYNVEVKKVIGDDMNVTGVELYNNKTKQTSVMPTSGVFLAIGHDPNTQLFKKSLATDAQGYICVQNRSQKTSVPGVFAAGDVEDKQYRQAIVAAGSGARAALDATAFLGDIGFDAQVAAQLESHLFSACKKALAHGVQKIESLDDFKKNVEENEGFVFVDFFADYCSSCMHMLPHFESVAQEFAGKATFAKVDVEQAPDVVKKLFVHKVPCMMVFRDGSLVARYSNIMNEKELADFIEQFLQEEGTG